MKKIILEENICQEMHKLYENGYTREKLENKYGISGTVIIRIFKEHGWNFRPANYSKYKVNENYFDNIDTHDKAYIVGLLFADGCNHEERNTISLELQETDKDIVENINKIINIDRPIYYYNYVGKYGHKQGTYTMLCCNKHISEQLHNLGMVKNKSLILDYPSWIDDELFPSLLRGYIDGDGWVSKKTIGFMSSDKFCYGVQEYLKDKLDIESKVMDMKREYNEHTKTLYIANFMDKQRISEIMFSNGQLKMQRKYDKYIYYSYLQ